jgi:hypothetical protein
MILDLVDRVADGFIAGAKTTGGDLRLDPLSCIRRQFDFHHARSAMPIAISAGTSRAAAGAQRFQALAEAEGPDRVRHFWSLWLTGKSLAQPQIVEDGPEPKSRGWSLRCGGAPGYDHRVRVRHGGSGPLPPMLWFDHR